MYSLLPTEPSFEIRKEEVKKRRVSCRFPSTTKDERRKNFIMNTSDSKCETQHTHLRFFCFSLQKNKETVCMDNTHIHTP